MSDHRLPRPRRVLLVALAATATATPAASARLAPEAVSSDRNPPPVVDTAARDSVPAAAPTITRTITDDGLDWGSAALGAGGAVALVLLTAGSGSAVIRHRQRVGAAR